MALLAPQLLLLIWCPLFSSSIICKSKIPWNSHFTEDWGQEGAGAWEVISSSLVTFRSFNSLYATNGCKPHWNSSRHYHSWWNCKHAVFSMTYQTAEMERLEWDKHVVKQRGWSSLRQVRLKNHTTKPHPETSWQTATVLSEMLMVEGQFRKRSYSCVK